MYKCKHCNKDNSIRWNAYGEGQCKFCNKPWSLKDELDRQKEEYSLLTPPRNPITRKTMPITSSTEKQASLQVAFTFYKKS